MKDRITVFTGPHGLLCYEARVTFRGPLSPKQFVDSMLSSGLQWYWDSGQMEFPPGSEAPVPAERELTRLDADTASAFVADIQEGETDRGRGFSALGLDAAAPPLLPGEVKPAVAAFLRNQGPLRVVVIQVGDVARESIFVHHDMPAAVRTLLLGWGVDPSGKHRKRRYGWLGGVRLERVYELP